MYAGAKWYKAARWNGQEVDEGPGAVEMKVNPNRLAPCHGDHYLVAGLDPAFESCRVGARCGFARKR